MNEMMGHPKRFMDNVRLTETGCWEWKGSKRKDGYGRYRLDGRTVLAHRASQYYASGTILPSELKVCHRCDNPSCVNPGHFFIGSQADNIRDMFAKGRGNHPVRSGELNSQSKLTKDQVETIRSGKFKSRYLSKLFGVSESTVSMVKRGHNWRSV